MHPLVFCASSVVCSFSYWFFAKYMFPCRIKGRYRNRAEVILVCIHARHSSSSSFIIISYSLYVCEQVYLNSPAFYRVSIMSQKLTFQDIITFYMGKGSFDLRIQGPTPLLCNFPFFIIFLLIVFDLLTIFNFDDIIPYPVTIFYKCVRATMKKNCRNQVNLLGKHLFTLM